ncbi:hypothetical protein GEMRC1_009304 [Eukaryota sp. GEM-RC1]
MGPQSLLFGLLLIHCYSWKSTPVGGTPPSARQYVHNVVIGEVVYYFGGMDFNDQPLSDIWSFNTTELSWLQLPSLGSPPKSFWGCLWHYKNSLFFFGDSDINTISVYSFRDYTWVNLPFDINAPSARQMMGCEQLVINDESYGILIGGTSADVELQNEIWALSLSTLKWQLVSAYGQSFIGRQFPNTAVLDFLPNTILVFSGRTMEDISIEDRNDTWLLSFSELDGSIRVDCKNVSNQISGVAPVATVVSSTAMLPYSSQLFVIGGWLMSRHQSYSEIQVLSFNRSTDPRLWTWDRYPLRKDNHYLNFSLDSCTSSVVKDRIFVFGGFYNEVDVSNTLLVLEPLTEYLFSTLSVDQIVPPSFSQHSFVVVGDIAYVLGGYTSGDPLLESVIWHLNLTTETWHFNAISSSYVADRRIGQCAVGYSRRIYYIFGISLTTNQMVSHVDVYDTVSLTWTKMEFWGDVPSARAYCCCSRFNNLIFIFGGRDSSGISDHLSVLNVQSGHWSIIRHPSHHPPAMERCGLFVISFNFQPYLLLSFGRLTSWMPYQSHIWKADVNDVIITSSITWIQQPLRLEYPLLEADSIQVLVFEQLLILIGGENFNLYTGYVSYYLLPQLSDTKSLSVTLIERLETFMKPTLHFAVTGFMNRIYLFGGTLVRAGMRISSFSLSSLYLRELDCALYSKFPCNDVCFVGSYLKNSTCDLCSPGFYGVTNSHSQSCEPCPPGFFSNRVGVIGSESCLPCPYNSYQPSSGSSNCLPCPEGATCRMGAIRPESESHVDDVSVYSWQPPLPDSNAPMVNAISTQIFVIVFIIIVLFLAVVIILGEKSSILLKFDVFARQHYTQYDHVMVKRKTQLGSVFTFWFLFLALAFVSILIVEFSYDNYTFRRMMEPAFLLTQEMLFSANISFR